ncbi:MAG: membrane protein required for colicin V production [Candidatus Tokpelaia sp. JSC188]|nr:MAG: membrane protein required for colicin V production [Candidatus Tokpelaia sp. JSC188]
MPITALDGLVILLILLSTFLAMVRGFLREILSLLPWIMAMTMAYFFYKPMLPLLEPYISNHMLVTVIAITGIFVIALIIISAFTMKLADIIINNRISTLDRTLGFIFGFVRSVLILVVATLFINGLIPSNQPAWIVNAKTKPMLDVLSNKVWNAVPKNIFQQLKKSDLLKTPPSLTIN